MAIGIGRRQFISALGGATVAWPLAVHAQQAAMPVIGFFHATTAEANHDTVAAFRDGLSQNRLRRGPECSHRISLGGRSIRSAACN